MQSNVVPAADSLDTSIVAQPSKTPRPPRPRSDDDAEPEPEAAGWEIRKRPSETGVCHTCAYEPVAYDASVCPRCGVRNPNPGVINRYAGKGVGVGLIVCILLGASTGLVGKASWAGVLAGAVFGAPAGLFVGLVGGIVAGILARLSGRR